MSTLKGINSITLPVTNLEQSIQFYEKTLGLTPLAQWNNGAYISLQNVWLHLHLVPSNELTNEHSATRVTFNISPEDFTELELTVKNNDVPLWRAHYFDDESLYILDPDHNKLEIHCSHMKSRLRKILLRQNLLTAEDQATHAISP